MPIHSIDLKSAEKNLAVMQLNVKVASLHIVLNIRCGSRFCRSVLFEVFSKLNALFFRHPFLVIMWYVLPLYSCCMKAYETALGRIR